MGINSFKHKFYSSSIVGGGISIGMGIAMGLKRNKKKGTVWIFIGDMTFETGTFHECYKYSRNFKLPLKFVVINSNLDTILLQRLDLLLSSLYEVVTSSKYTIFLFSAGNIDSVFSKMVLGLSPTKSLNISRGLIVPDIETTPAVLSRKLVIILGSKHTFSNLNGFLPIKRIV